MEDFTRILRAGADKVSVNSAALRNPAIIQEAAYKFGSQCVVVAMDAKRRPEGAGPCTSTAAGWTRERTPWSGPERWSAGRGEILLTSMDCDGTKAGYDLELTRAISEAVSIPGDRLRRGGDHEALL
mgnify:CR=1 FL=1